MHNWPRDRPQHDTDSMATADLRSDGLGLSSCPDI